MALKSHSWTCIWRKAWSGTPWQSAGGNLSATAEYLSLIPGVGRLHMPQSSKTFAQLLSLPAAAAEAQSWCSTQENAPQWDACPPQRGPTSHSYRKCLYSKENPVQPKSKQITWSERTRAPQCSLQYSLQHPRHGSSLHVHQQRNGWRCDTYIQWNITQQLKRRK